MPDEYIKKIPGLLGDNFGITYLETEITNHPEFKPGYYGINGGMTITERSDTRDGAMELLRVEIGKIVKKEIRRIDKRQKDLTEAASIADDQRKFMEFLNSDSK